MRSLQGSRSPILNSLNTALSPVTSHDGLHSLAQGTREATVSSSASDDEQRYTLGGAQHQASFFMKTPPTTPGLGRNFSNEPMLAIDSAWNYVPTDEPLITPGLGSFGSDEFSMAPSVPNYVVNSQPATPSYPSSGVGPTYFPFTLSGSAPTQEYAFPGESYSLPDSAVRLSPTTAKSKQFQFTQNITPQDFSVEK